MIPSAAQADALALFDQPADHRKFQIRESLRPRRLQFSYPLGYHRKEQFVVLTIAQGLIHPAALLTRQGLKIQFKTTGRRLRQTR